MIYESTGITNGYHVDKEAWIDDIIEECHYMDADDELDVYNFGLNGDLALRIYKDPDYNPFYDPDEWDIVRVYTFQRNENSTMEIVDETEDVYITDGSLASELQRIWEYKDFGLIN